MISAASSSSRMATQARPTRDRSRFPTNSSTMMISTMDSQNHQTPEFSVAVDVAGGEDAERVAPR